MSSILECLEHAKHGRLVSIVMGGGSSQVVLVVRRCGFDPWIRKTPWMRAWQRTAVFLSGESHGQSSMADYSP